MRLPLIRLGETLELLERLKVDTAIPPYTRYHISAIYRILNGVAGDLAPILTGDWKDDQWIEDELSPDFAPLSLDELEALDDVTVQELRTLMRITTN